MLPARSRLGAVLALVATLLVGTLILTSPASADTLAPPVLDQPVANASPKANPVFTWAPVARAAKYRIQVSTTAAFSSTAYTADVHGTSATPTTELPLGTLHWRVATLDGGNDVGPYSDSRSFTRVQADAPVLVSPASGTELQYPTDPAVLTWQAVSGVKQYRVELDDEDTFTGATSFTTAGTSLALPTALPSKSVRYWRVQGVSTDPAIATAWSNATDPRSFSVAWPTTTKPTLLTPADALDTDTDEIEFSWTPVPGAAKYEIQTSTDVDFNADLTSQVTGATHYRLTNALKQDQYFWRVRALQPNGDPTAWSSVRAFKREWLDTDGLAARPTVSIIDADGLIADTQLEQDRISISWTPVRGAAYYELEVSTDPTFLEPAADTSMVHRICRTPNTQWTPYIEGIYTETSGFAGCPWTSTSTMAGPGVRFIRAGAGPYYVRVRAIDVTPSGGERTTLWSNAAREGGTAPPAPFFTTFLATRGAGETTVATEPATPLLSPNSAGTPKLTWKPVDGAEAYLLAMARDSSFNNNVLQGPYKYVVTTNTEFVLNQALLDNSVGQPYFWYVLPCLRWDASALPQASSNVCNVGAADAVNNPDKIRSFKRLGKAVETLPGASPQTDTVELKWRDQNETSPDGGGIKHYELEVRDAASNLAEPVVRTDATGYSPIDRYYPEGQYSWRVRAIDAANVGLAWSAPVTFQKKSSIPAPQPVTPGAGLPVLTWDATAFAGSYDVEVYRGADGTFAAGNKVATISGRKYPSATLPATLDADTYSWRVRQLDAASSPNAGPWSTAVQSFTVGGAQPTLQSPTDGATVQARALRFDWSDVPGAVRYRFEASTTSGFGTIPESVLTVSSTYASTFGFAGGTPYFWRVTAIDADDHALATSDTKTFTPLTTPRQVSAAATLAGTKINATWTAPDTGGSPVTGYVVHYRPTGTTAWTDIATGADAASTVIGGLAPSQSYDVQVAAENAVGLGQFSTSATVTTPAPSLPPAPTNLTLTPNATGFLATWTAPNVGSGPPLTGYVVRVVEAAGGTPTEQTVTAAQADLTGLAQATAYAIDVAATNEFGRGAFVSANGTTGAPAGTPTPTPGESPTPRPTPTATPLPVSSPTPEPSASPDPAPAVVACNVPKLKGKSKAAAKKALRAANCSVGPIAGKRRGVVKTQLPKAGQVRPAGSRVALVLGKKKKK